MSNSRLGLKRSLSGEGDSVDGGGTDGSTTAQLSLVKKRKTTSPRHGNDIDEDVDGSLRDARGKGKGAVARTMDKCAVEHEISITKLFGTSNEDNDGKHSSSNPKSNGGSSFAQIDRFASPLCEDRKRPPSATTSIMPSAGSGSRDRSSCARGMPSPQGRSRSKERELRGCNRGASKSRSRSAERGGHSEAGDPESEPKLSVNDVNHCGVPRQYLERWMNDPFFEKAVLGCFIRVATGVDPEGKRIYEMVEIVGVGSYQHPYKIGDSLVTSKCLKVSTNDDVVRDQCMDVVSNSPITAGEFNVWKEERRRIKAPIISKSQCTERRARMMRIAQNHKYTAEEVATMVRERRKERVACKNTTLTHIKLSKSLQAAVTAGKVEEADLFRKQLAKLDAREARAREFLKIRAAKAREVNERATSLNVQTNSSVARKRRRDEATSSQPNNVEIDPYKRRACRPKQVGASALLQAPEVLQAPARRDRQGTSRNSSSTNG